MKKVQPEQERPDVRSLLTELQEFCGEEYGADMERFLPEVSGLNVVWRP